MSEDTGKIFVGGLSWATTEEKLGEYFGQFGKVVESKVMKDRNTGNPRGFGFIKYEDPDSVDAVMKARPHVLDDKPIDPKPCTPKEIQQKRKEAERNHVKTHKIFIGGLPREISENEVKEYFKSFGEVAEVNFAISKVDNKNKGFGFVTFSSPDAVEECINKHYHEIGGRRVEAKRAEPRENNNRKPPENNQQWGNNNNFNGMGQQGNNMGQGYNNQMQGGWGGGGGGGYGYGMPQMMGPSGGYMPPNPGYAYGGFGGMYPGYGGYGGYPQQGPNQPGPGGPNQPNQTQQGGNGYPQMGQYNQYGSSYGPMYGNGDNNQNQSSGKTGGNKDQSSNKQGYHPYKR